MFRDIRFISLILEEANAVNEAAYGRNGNDTEKIQLRPKSSFNYSYKFRSIVAEQRAIFEIIEQSKKRRRSKCGRKPKRLHKIVPKPTAMATPATQSPIVNPYDFVAEEEIQPVNVPRMLYRPEREMPNAAETTTSDNNDWYDRGAAGAPQQLLFNGPENQGQNYDSYELPNDVQYQIPALPFAASEVNEENTSNSDIDDFLVIEENDFNNIDVEIFNDISDDFL